MANVCERCKCSLSSHDDHASCPQCRMAAGECHLDIENPCNICGGWTTQQWGKLRRSLVDARARASQRGRQHWTAAFPRLEARPVVSTEQTMQSTQTMQSPPGYGTLPYIYCRIRHPCRLQHPCRTLPCLLC